MRKLIHLNMSQTSKCNIAVKTCPTQLLQYTDPVSNSLVFFGSRYARQCVCVCVCVCVRACVRVCACARVTTSGLLPLCSFGSAV